jgi:hypothetical protein
MLVRRRNEKTDRVEYALVARKKKDKSGRRKVLYWFGPNKPSTKEFQKQESRIQYFKHVRGQHCPTLTITSEQASQLTLASIYLPPVSRLKGLRGTLARVAQSVYDDWGPDEDGNIWCRTEQSSGGICHLIADDLCDAIGKAGFECTTYSHDDIVHVSVFVKTAEGLVHVNIDPYLYETGGGYSWQKKPNVRFKPEDISIEILNSDPESFNAHLDY